MKIQNMFRPLMLLGATAIGLAAFSFFLQPAWQKSLWGWLVLVVVLILGSAAIIQDLRKFWQQIEKSQQAQQPDRDDQDQQDKQG